MSINNYKNKNFRQDLQMLGRFAIQFATADATTIDPTAADVAASADTDAAIDDDDATTATYFYNN